MKLFVIWALVYFINLPSNNRQIDKKLSVVFSKNIELTGYLIHLADPDNNDPNHPVSKELNSYADDRQRPVLGEIFATAGSMK